MSDTVHKGSRRNIDGKPCVFFDGYWVKWYEPPRGSLAAKKRLIAALTLRLFNHVEHGINMPGNRLNEARTAFEAEADSERERVKGAMLAGALFNRATDKFQKAVELQECGVSEARAVKTSVIPVSTTRSKPTTAVADAEAVHRVPQGSRPT